MSTDASHTNADAALSAQTGGRPVPKKITNAQTVCNEKNEKGKLCNGHLKQLRTGDEEAEVHLRGEDVLFKCQTCGTLYMGPPLGHVRDPQKQQRFVQKELTILLQAAGGTLPAFRKSETGAWIPADHTPAPAKPAPPPTPPSSSPVPAAKSAPAQAAAPPPPPRATNVILPNETFEEKRVRLARVVAEAKARDGKISPNEIEATVAALLSRGAGQTRPAAAVTSGTDSSAAADVYRPAAEAQAATGQASAAPLSPAAATASPAAPPPTADDEEVEPTAAPAPAASTTAPAADATPPVDAAPTRKGIPPPPPHLAPPPGETFEQKKARLAQVVADAKARAGKS